MQEAHKGPEILHKLTDFIDFVAGITKTPPKEVIATIKEMVVNKHREAILRSGYRLRLQNNSLQLLEGNYIVAIYRKRERA